MESTSDVCHELTVVIGQLAAVRYDAVDLNDEQLCERLAAIIERVRACRDAVGIVLEKLHALSEITDEPITERVHSIIEQVHGLRNGLGAEPSEATKR